MWTLWEALQKQFTRETGPLEREGSDTTQLSSIRLSLAIPGVSKNGIIIELSRKEDDVFCITEFEDKIRVMGKLDTEINTVKPGQFVKLTRCLFNDKNSFFFSLECK